MKSFRQRHKRPYRRDGFSDCSPPLSSSLSLFLLFLWVISMLSNVYDPCLIVINDKACSWNISFFIHWLVGCGFALFCDLFFSFLFFLIVVQSFILFKAVGFLSLCMSIVFAFVFFYFCCQCFQNLWLKKTAVFACMFIRMKYCILCWIMSEQF